MDFRRALPLFLFLSFISCASAPKKSRMAAPLKKSPAALSEESVAAGEEDSYPLTLSESLSDTGNLKDRIERQLARKYDFDRDLKHLSGKESKRWREEEVAFAREESIDFGDVELSVSERKREEALKSAGEFSSKKRRRGLSSTGKKRAGQPSRNP